jgi:hypothetical protein
MIAMKRLPIIEWHRMSLAAGKTIAEADAAVVRVEGSDAVVDDSLEGFGYAPQSAGPGTELKAILARAGIVAGPGCSCNAMAARMDAWGEECVEHMAEIVEHLRAQAEARGLPFLDAAGRALVRVSIARARRNQP